MFENIKNSMKEAISSKLKMMAQIGAWSGLFIGFTHTAFDKSFHTLGTLAPYQFVLKVIELAFRIATISVVFGISLAIVTILVLGFVGFVQAMLRSKK